MTDKDLRLVFPLIQHKFVDIRCNKPSITESVNSVYIDRLEIITTYYKQYLVIVDGRGNYIYARSIKKIIPNEK